MKKILLLFFAASFLGQTISAQITPIADINIAEGAIASTNISITHTNGVYNTTFVLYDKSDPTNSANNPITPSVIIPDTEYAFTDNGSGQYSFSWDTDPGEGGSYLARVTTDDGINPAEEALFSVNVAQPIPANILAKTFANPLPWYGGNPQSPFTVAIETTTAENIGWINPGEFVEYLIDVPQAGTYAADFYCGKGNGGTLTVTLSEEDNGGFTPIGSFGATSSGWQNYVLYTTQVTFTNPGVQTLRLDFSGQGGVNIRDFEFTPATAPIFTKEIEDQTNLENDIPLGLQVIADDPDGGSVTFSDNGTLPPGLIINANTGLIFGTIAVGAAANSPYNVVITATNVNAPSETATSSFNWTVYAVVGLPLCINSGNQGGITAFGKTFTADQYSTSSVGNYNALTSPIAGTTPGSGEEDLFQSEKYGDPLSYAIPTGNETFTVELYFAEIFANAVGARVFNIDIEGIRVETDLDIFAEVGQFTALVKTYTVVVTDGILDIVLDATVDNGKLSGICVSEFLVPTPIALADFSAKPHTEKSVMLDWITSSEENNEYFSIEHSTDGRNFTSIDMVEGALNSTVMQYYSYEHKEASIGNNYYRLRQVDTDGTFSFSPIEVVRLAGDLEIKVLPTLADNFVTIGVDEAFDNDVDVEIYDVLGRLVFAQTLGRGDLQVEIPVSDFQKGHYFVRINNNTKSRVARFIKG